MAARTSEPFTGIQRARQALGEVPLSRRCCHAIARRLRPRRLGARTSAIPRFSDDPLDGFRDLATDLVRFGSVFLAGTTAEFAALVTKAERTRRSNVRDSAR